VQQIDFKKMLRTRRYTIILIKLYLKERKRKHYTPLKLASTMEFMYVNLNQCNGGCFCGSSQGENSAVIAYVCVRVFM